MKRSACLIYVMGPSGAGKTRLIDYARRKIAGRLPIAFSHRYITRPLGDDSENYIALSHEEFALRKSRNLFACHWTAYGIEYGIGVEIQSWMKSGLDVVLDGSRAHFIAHQIEIAPLVPVLITATRNTLQERLKARQREDVRSIQNRLKRAEKFAPADLAVVTIDNSGSLEVAGEKLIAILSERSRLT